jgi:glutathione synthase/RimK-type ligase-like ATP-grasp enzyme
MELIEIQGNKLCPPKADILLWENKVYMHSKFDELDINAPKTIIISHNQIDLNLIENTLNYPFLIKEPFSNHSRGIYFINSRDELIMQAS